MTHTITLKADAFTKLKGLTHAAGVEEARYYLKGVYIDGDKGRAVATDGHVMALFNHDELKNCPPVIIPSTLLNSFKKYNVKKDTITITVDGDMITIKGDYTDIISSGKAIDGTFPDYVRIIPAPTEPEHIAQMALGLPVMLVLCGLAKAAGNPAIRFDHLSATAAQLVTIGCYSCVVMPMRY